MKIAEQLKAMTDSLESYHRSIDEEVRSVVVKIIDANNHRAIRFGECGIRHEDDRTIDYKDHDYFKWDYYVESETIHTEIGRYECWNEFVEFPAKLLGDTQEIYQYVKGIRNRTEEVIEQMKPNKLRDLDTHIAETQRLLDELNLERESFLKEKAND